MNIGYLRVSTDTQNLKNQTEEIERYVLNNKMILDDKIEIEISSRKTLEQRKINELFSMLKENDNLLVCELSRLARSLKELEIIVEQFKIMKVNLILIKEGLTIKHDDNNPMTKMFFQMLGMFAEFERNLISMRTKEALASRKGAGVLGHNKKFMKNSFDAHETQIYKYLENGINYTTITKLLNVESGTTTLKAPALTKWINKRYTRDNMLKTWQMKKEWKEYKENLFK